MATKITKLYHKVHRHKILASLFQTVPVAGYSCLGAVGIAEGVV